MENRLYAAPECNATLAFAFANHDLMPTGHMLVPDKWLPWTEEAYHTIPSWRSRSWEEGLRKWIVPHLRPNVLVLGLARSNRIGEMRAIRAAARSAIPNICFLLKVDPLRGNVTTMMRPHKMLEREVQQLVAAFPDDVVFNAPKVLRDRLGRPLSTRDFFDPPRCIHFTAASGVNRLLNQALIEQLRAECPSALGFG